MRGGHAKQRLSGPHRLAPALLPVLKRGDAYPDHERELALRATEAGTDSLYIGRSELEGTARLGLAAVDTARLLYAGNKLTEILSFHGDQFGADTGVGPASIFE